MSDLNKQNPAVDGGSINGLDQFSAEQLEARQRTAEKLLQQAAERVSEASQEGPRVSYFDWEFPDLTTPNLFTFLARVRCQAGERSLRFQIDIARLAAEGRTADLERLLNILAARHAGLDDRHSLVKSVEWMLSISLKQTSPQEGGP
jgi:hypothetical protein